MENADGRVVVNEEEQFQGKPKAPMVTSDGNIFSYGGLTNRETGK